ncbi:SufE family protein [Otariodibacter sp.]|uniref:SufE family protein n=1 Tax=Otariodibacter sp. TaxID=3030919 RepID=UPI002637318C|nr:SufE family protein [Otariodibacter sp.]
MSIDEIYIQFANCKSWEERYRLLIQLSKKLPKPTEEELAQWTEIHGCESRLWFEFQLEPRIIKAYSDARLMQGLLVIVTASLSTQSREELKLFNIQKLFDDLGITRHLTSTRLNGLNQIETRVKQVI